ncbi:MAG TPA: SMP-30/gluconolactonase/LRE family protein, partial [Alphaproteobacteria bacterium]|nr:SMP-30/gluconolactonase/LRE family protein [Alphaproteobacteria bacterium]
MPVLPISAARVFFDGIFSEPRLAHPEGVAVHRDGSIWCGTETGDLLRIAADGSRVERLGTTGGFALGIAFDSAGNCFVCDLRHAAVFRYDAATRALTRFAASGILVPNYPVVDERRGVLYVSDSRGEGNPGPGIFRYDLRTGEGGVWSRAPMHFANGMAMALDGSGLYVVESHGPHVSYVPIEADGSAGAPRVVIPETHNVPDGLAIAPDGTLYVSCYEPSRIYRLRPGGRLEVLIEDRAATLLAHPTNIALKG